MAVTVTPALRRELAPAGTLRVALNLSNTLLVSTAPPDGEPTGVAPDVGRELASRLAVPVAFVRYPNPGDMVADASTGVWDVGLIGADPLRAGEIVFTPSYCEIEASYLVPAGSPIRSIDEVDQPGVRIAVADKTAYDMHLRRTIRYATLHRAPGGEGSFQLFLGERLDALAGLRAVLANSGDRHADTAHRRRGLPEGVRAGPQGRARGTTHCQARRECAHRASPGKPVKAGAGPETRIGKPLLPRIRNPIRHSTSFVPNSRMMSSILIRTGTQHGEEPPAAG